MNSKTFKAVIAALTIVGCHQAHAAAGRDNNVQPVTCCNGNITGDCQCTLTQPAGRARGEEVTFRLARATAKALNASGQIEIPKVGSLSIFTYKAPESDLTGDKTIRLLFASFDLNNINANKDADATMKRILKTAKDKNPSASTLIWVGRQLPGQPVNKFAEVSETLTTETKLNAQVSYITHPDGRAVFTLPTLQVKGKSVPGEVIKVDLGALK